MIHYVVEFILWLLLAFFLGAILGCLLRRLFAPAESSRGEAVAPQERREAPARAEARIGGAASAETAAGAEASGAETAAAEPTSEETSGAETGAVESTSKETSGAETTASAETGAAAEPSGAESEMMPLAASEGAEETTPKEAEPSGEGEKEQAPPPFGLSAPIGGKPDNLTEISGIGKKIEKILHDLGVYHFRQIASWTEKDIAEVDEKLKFKGRIQRERWVEQARILAEGGETEFSKRVQSGDVPTSRKS